MTPQHIAAMQQALECLESLQGGCTDHDDGTVEAITVWCPEVCDALRQALEQPAQKEPFGWYSAQVDEFMTHKTRTEHERLNSYTHKVGGFDLALYTRHQAPEPLTVEQIDDIASEYSDEFGMIAPDSWEDFARAIEAALGIKGDA